MDENAWKTVNRLLDEALDLPASERQRWLDELHAEYDPLKPRLESLLAHAEDPRLRTIPKLTTERVPPIVADDDSVSTGEAGQTIGCYRLKRMIGKGGMGAVWLAERADGLMRRSVALKLPRGIWSRPELQSRLVREREILASLDHPNIARLYDAGLTDDGQPYLALELVEGRPVNEYAQANALDIRGRLTLFLQFARAVAYAHSQLVVHRDIKPSNILVTDSGRVCLLDFGIAKLLEDGQTHDSEITEIAGRALTLAYAAPEQVSGDPIGVAGDVYSLGVVLYELLAGKRPYALPRETSAALENAILHVDPAPPSEAAGESSLRRVLRGDLDTIVLKALKKSPRERYPTVEAFVDDVERYFRGRPVKARPDSVVYRLGKFVRRHRAAVLVATLAVVALVGFSLSSLRQARRIAVERDRAAVEEQNARRMLDLVVGLFETADPTRGPGGDTLAVDGFLEEAREKIDALDEQPDLKARMEHVLGRIYLARSRYREARALFEDAYELYRSGSERDEVFALDLEIDLARALERTSDLGASEERLRDILPRLEQVRGEDHPLVTQTLVRLGRIVGGAEGEALATEALWMERRRTPTNPTELGRALAGVAEHRHRAGDRRTAETLYREAAEIFVAELGEEHPYTQTTLTNLAGVIVDVDEQVALYRRLIVMGQEIIGPDTGPVANRLNNFGVLLWNHGRFDEAEAALAEAVRIWSKVGGDDHWRTAYVRSNLAIVYAHQSRPDEALALTRDALETARRSTGKSPRVLGVLLTRWALLLSRAGRAGEALASARDAVALLEGADMYAPDLANARLVLGQILVRDGQHAEAESVLRAALEHRESALDRDDPRLGQARCALGSALAGLGRAQEAEPFLRQGVAALDGWVLADPADVLACRSSGA